MPNRNHRPQKAEEVAGEDTRPLAVHATAHLDDRMHNPKDLDPTVADHGIEHGGMNENRAGALNTRGTGGRKRSGPFGRYRSGADNSKKR